MKNLIKKFIPSFLLSIYHYSLALASAFWYGFPSRELKVIGVTGTKGKSTTVIMAGRILEGAGLKVAWLTSATIKIGEKEELNPYHMTMPGRFTIQKFLKKAVMSDCEYAILEITSEGIKQYRHKFIDFDTAVFTNLRPEHIEAHGSFGNYRFCKGKLFEATNKNHILNLDDKNVDYFLKFKAENKIGYTFEHLGEEKYKNIKIIQASNLKTLARGSKFNIGKTEFSINLLGEFNAYNALAAVCIGSVYGVSLKKCQKTLEKIKIMPGRMEIIIKKPFKVIVDLAHTPDSFEELFKAVKNLNHNKIISVFGAAGGGRDKWKRPILGKIAASYSDFIILCNEDTYDENPNQILSEIKSGVIGSGFPTDNLYEILDRREAIRKALELAKQNDIVLLIGKGTEQLMIIGSERTPWDDRLVVKEEIKRRA